MIVDTTVRRILVAELHQTIEDYDATPSTKTAVRVRLARKRKDLEIEITEYDRTFAKEINR